MGGLLVVSDDTSLFSDKSLEYRLHQSLNQNIATENRYYAAKMTLEPTLEVARLVQQVELLRETNQELRHENKVLIAGGQSLEKQKEELAEARMTAELRERETRQECASLQNELEQANVQIEQKVKEIQKLKAQTEKRSAETKELLNEQRSAANEVIEKVNQEISSLRIQNVALEQEKNDLAKELEGTRVQLSRVTAECEARKASVNVGVQTDSPSVHTDAQTDGFHITETNADTESAPTSGAMVGRMADDMEALVATTSSRKTSPGEHSDPLPIGERLCRIRDAAERASLVKEHQREISRLKAEHESEKKALHQKYEKEKDKLLEEAMSEMNAGYKGLRRRLESEHEKKSEKTERHYRTEMERVSTRIVTCVIRRVDVVLLVFNDCKT